MEFDTLADARAVFQTEHHAGRYRSGTLLHWYKVSDDWELVDRFLNDSRTPAGALRRAARRS
jgi:hypothetical protein